MLAGLFAIFLGAFSGSGIVPSLTKIGLQFSAPVFFVFFRFLFASILFLPIIIFSRKEKLEQKDYIRFTFLAFLLFVNVTFFTIGVNLTTVLMSQLLYLPTPIIVSILGHFFLNEKLNIHKMIGLLIALGGVLFLIIESAINQREILTFGTPLGNSIVLIAMLGYSGWVLYSRMLAKKHAYSSYQVTFFTFLFIALYLLILLPFSQNLAPSKIQAINFHGIIFAIFVSSASIIQYLFLQIGIKKTSAFTASMFQYVGPVFAGIISVPVLHEYPSPVFLIAGAIIICGVFYGTTFDYVKSKNKSKSI